jgi:hypothetical protein
MRSLTLVALCVVVVAACGSPSNTPDGGSGGGTAAGGGHAGGGSATGGGSGGGGGAMGGGSSGPHDAGQSCADPIPLTLGMLSPMEHIEVEGKRVFFTITLDAGAFLDIATKCNPGDVSGVLDTAITLYDATGATELASDDDAFPRLSTDSELFYRTQAPQTLCMSVEDYSTWSGGTPMAHPNDTFRLTVSALAPSTVNNPDTEPNDDATSAQTGTIQTVSGGATGAARIYGGLDTMNDVDVYRFTMPSGAAQMQVWLPPNGDKPAPMVSTYGSTMQRFAMKVTTMDGTVVGALSPPPGFPTKMSAAAGIMVTPGTTYLLWIQRALPAGMNDFYASEVDFVTDNPPELEMLGASTNNTLAMAETLTLNAGAPKTKDGFITGRLTPSDVDFFSFTLGAGDSVVLACSSRRDGSGLTAPTFDFVDGAGTSLQSETETDTADVLWDMGGSKPAVVAPDAGTFALKVSATGQDSVNTGNFYRCGLHVTSP